MSGAPVSALYDLQVDDIDGKAVKLEKYRGKALLIVNVASKCGLTPQYKSLESLYQKYKEQGLVVLGFPANNFGGQEPGSNQDIKQFCSTTYGVTFPMFAKVSVAGADQAPLYKWLIEQSDRPKDAIEWNFAKFVVDREGKLIARLSPRSAPESPEVIASIERALRK